MPFSEEVKRKAWERAGGRCECKRVSCGHPYRCNKQLIYTNHNEGERGAWEAHHIVAEINGGSNTLSNCEVLCLDCHKNTKSYGRHY